MQTDRGKTVQRMPSAEGNALIRVIGVGGGGGNAVNRMIEENIVGVEYVAVNTDNQVLMTSQAPVRVALGERTTRGLGSGGDPEVGKRAAEESVDDLRQVLNGSDMVFVTACMGGGTGTGASATVAKVAREAGALTIGVVTRPFSFEGTHKARLAEAGIEELKEQVDTLIVIPNDKLLETADRRMSLLDSFRQADDVLRQGIQGISELITVPGLINLDFADVKSIMSLGGAALMAVGIGSGEDRAHKAAEAALSSQLLDITIDGARGILFNITGGPDLSLFEINQAATQIRETAHPDVNLIFGAVIDEEMGDEVRITMIATGFEHTLPMMRSMRPTAANNGQRPSTTTRENSRSMDSAEVSSTPAPSPRQPQGLNPRMDNLDIPAFLRKR